MSDMHLVDVLGYIAAVCTTGAYLPQSMRVWRTRSAEDVSLRMVILSLSGNSMWFAFGLFTASWPLVAASVVTVLLAATILVGKLRFG